MLLCPFTIELMQILICVLIRYSSIKRYKIKSFQPRGK